MFYVYALYLEDTLLSQHALWYRGVRERVSCILSSRKLKNLEGIEKA
jgi:hypothetical protein